MSKVAHKLAEDKNETSSTSPLRLCKFSPSRIVTHTVGAGQAHNAPRSCPLVLSPEFAPKAMFSPADSLKVYRTIDICPFLSMPHLLKLPPCLNASEQSFLGVQTSFS